MSFRSRRVFPAVLLALSATMAGCVAPETDDDPASSASDELSSVPSFGSNPGNLKMYIHAPAGVGAGAPVVVALHGCSQTAQDYVKAGWSQLADAWGFYVVYPEQSTSNNPVRCFRWYESSQTKRNAGEAHSIKQMVDHMKATYSIDPARVYITGLSGGAAMAVSLLAAYPDVFAAGAPMAGLPHLCASTINDSFNCMGGKVDRTPKAWGDLVRASFPGVVTGIPRISIWQGASDTIVSTVNQRELTDQWTDVHGIDTTADATTTVDGAKRTEHRDASGKTVVEVWSVPNMGHGTAVDPGLAVANGCGATGAYAIDANVCSSYRAAQFFGLDPADGGNPPADDPPADDPPADDPPADDPPADPPADPPVCVEHTSTNYHHVQAGRAYKCGIGGSYVCATGSGKNFGLYTLVTSTLRETPAGYFEPGKCP